MSLFKIDYGVDSIWDGLFKPILFYLVIFIVVFVGGIYLQDKNVACPHLGTSLQKEVKYDFWAGGCFIKLNNGNWVSSSNYNGVSLEK